MVEVTEDFLRQFIEGLRISAVAQQRAADSNVELARILAEIASDIRNGREAAVAEIKDHVTRDITARETWWRKAFILSAVALSVANLLGVPIGRVVSTILNIR